MFNNNVSIGQYIPGKTYIYSIDPRIKILILIVMMVFLFLVNTYCGFALLYLFAFMIIITARIPVKYTMKGLKPIVFLIVFTTIINIFAIKGEHVLLSIGSFNIYWESLSFSGILALRLLLLVIIASLLTLTTTPILLCDGLEYLLKPLKIFRIDSHEISMMMTIALRFIPTLMEETERIMKAQAARGADFDTGNFVQKAKSFIPVIIPLLTGSFRRAGDLAYAMESRCYRGGEGRTKFRVLKIKLDDIIYLAVISIFCTGVLLLDKMLFVI